MKALRVLCLSLSIVAVPAAWAQSCSGGADGGMDATGNQCTTQEFTPTPTPVAAAAAVAVGPTSATAEAAKPIRIARATVPSPARKTRIPVATRTRLTQR